MKYHSNYEILTSLPAKGPMYIPITQNGYPFYQEGFVIKFYRKNGTEWVANFEPGWTKLNKVFSFADKNIIVVIAGGAGYVINPDTEGSLSTFGSEISDVFIAENSSLICIDGIVIHILDDSNGELWTSERISWDGFKDCTYNDGLLTGLSFDPTNSINKWCPFSVDIRTRKVLGGSFKEFLDQNLHLELKNRIEIQEKSVNKKFKWKFWK